jgi:hypothetical protein
MTITITSGELTLDHAGLGAGAGLDRRLYFSHRALALAYRFWKRHFFRNLHNFWDLGRYSGPAGAGNFVVLCKPLLLIGLCWRQGGVEPPKYQVPADFESASSDFATSCNLTHFVA